jgi:hypothetical protein
LHRPAADERKPEKTAVTLRATISVVLSLILATGASAQWSAPSYMPPRPGEDIGVYLASVDGLSIQGIWRQHGNLNLGVRIGYMEGHGGLVTAAETWGRLFTGGVDFPVDVTWTLGAGAVFGDGTSAEVPVGLSVGRGFRFHPFTVQLYGHPRLALVVRDGAQGDDTEFSGLFDLGLDVMTERGMTLRFGTTMGNFSALGAGLAWSWGRAVVVR